MRNTKLPSCSKKKKLSLSTFISTPSLQASTLASTLHLPSVAALLPKLVSSASRSARVPTSRYRVGAAALGSSGRVFIGANLELPRAPLAQSVHAEQFVVALASQQRERGLKRIAVSAPPCGHCRQFCCELNCADELEFVFGEEQEEEEEEEEDGEGEGPRERREGANGAPTSTSPTSSSAVATLRALLPRHFGPHDLAKASGTKPKLLLDDSGVSLELTPRSLAAVAAAAAAAGEEQQGTEEGEQEQTSAFPASALAAAAEAALCAARGSHTPHTRCPAGLALVWRSGEEDEGGGEEEGSKTTATAAAATATEKKETDNKPSSPPLLRVSAGGAIESAAYNPSLPPLQAALVAAVADGMPPYNSNENRRRGLPSSRASSSSVACPSVVLGAVLVERPRARVSHAAATRAALAAFSRDSPPPLIVLHARGAARAPGAAEGESGYESGSEEEEEEGEEEEEEEQ